MSAAEHDQYMRLLEVVVLTGFFAIMGAILLICFWMLFREFTRK